ncbi:hypothetical protein NDU88_001463 [Pleurodeles waltl]|uniref:Uncharacterized protein n=1 Tax=Pleurodeles waltl TaxID=8319 RepID=A0AAV7L9U4_PLEWA|nr:hypothetical protein NDU88_001463 [Pleurodeles waltl]
MGASADEWLGESFSSYKVDMVLKNGQTTGEKMEKADATLTGGRPISGAQQKHAVKQDWCSGATSGMRCITGLEKLSGKIGGGTSSDMVSMVSVDQTNCRQKDRPQPVFTYFFTSGGQANGSAGPSTLSEVTIINPAETVQNIRSTSVGKDILPQKSDNQGMAEGTGSEDAFGDYTASPIVSLDVTSPAEILPQDGIMSLGNALGMCELQPGVESQPTEARSLAKLTGVPTSIVSLAVIQLQKDNNPEIHIEGIQTTYDNLPKTHAEGSTTRNSKEPSIDGGSNAEGPDEESGKTE